MNDNLIEIPDFAGYYASSEGIIYTTLKKGCRDRYDLSKRIEPTPLAYRHTNKGYCRVCLKRESSGKREELYVHRIVATLFIPNPENLPEVNHLDSNPKNNNINNLEWTDRKNNLKYAFEHGYMSRDVNGQFKHK